MHINVSNIVASKIIRHFRNEKETWPGELSQWLISGTVTGDREKVSAPSNDPRSRCESSLGPVSFSFLKCRIGHFQLILEAGIMIIIKY